MDQLPLNISPRLPYTPEGFLIHDGVAGIIALCRTGMQADGFKLFFIQGGARSGKTHLSIELTDLLMKEGLYPRLVDGRDLAAKLPELIPNDHRDILIVDDAQQYLQTVNEGESGPLVSCIELYRKARAGIIFLSTKELSDFPFDEHIRSRLVPGGGLSIKPPAPEYLSDLINRMARQRGIKLSERKIGFLMKRLDRNIQEIEEYLERVNYLSSVFGSSIKFPLLSDAL
jgi:chromosomal replication initiation ATPase DnaA